MRSIVVYAACFPSKFHPYFSESNFMFEMCQDTVLYASKNMTQEIDSLFNEYYIKDLTYDRSAHININLTEEKTPAKKERLFIGVTGGSASGKTTLAKRLEERFADESITIVSLDSFYKGLSDE